MIALAEPTVIGFTPSPALRQAQHEIRTATRAPASNWPVLDLIDFARNRWTSVAMRTVLSGAESAMQQRIETLQQQASILRRIAAAQVRVAKSTRDLVIDLRTLGMPISGIAEVVGVQRKTIYSWINDEEVVADPRNHDRLQAVSELLGKEPPGSLQFLTRHWERQLPDGGTLKGILAADLLDLERAREALAWLRPAVLRSIKQNRHHSGSEDATSPASSLTEYLEAVTK